MVSLEINRLSVNAGSADKIVRNGLMSKDLIKMYALVWVASSLESRSCLGSGQFDSCSSCESDASGGFAA